MSSTFKALVVDDSRFARKMIAVAVRNAAPVEWNFEFACTGLEAIRYLKEQDFDLVVSDVNMPELSGQGLLRYIRQQDRWENMPVVIVSSVGSGLAVPALVEKGATIVLPKPINTPESMARLSELVTGLVR